MYFAKNQVELSLFALFFLNIGADNSHRRLDAERTDIQADVVVFRVSPILPGVELLEFTAFVIRIIHGFFRPGPIALVITDNIFHPFLMIGGQKDPECIAAVAECIVATSADEYTALVSEHGLQRTERCLKQIQLSAARRNGVQQAVDGLLTEEIRHPVINTVILRLLNNRTLIIQRNPVDLSQPFADLITVASALSCNRNNNTNYLLFL